MRLLALILSTATALSPLSNAGVEILAGPLDGSLEVIDLQFQIKEEDQRTGSVKKSDSVEKPESYEIVKVGTNGPPLEIESVKPISHRGEIDTIHLKLKKPAVPANYTIKLNGSWKIKGRKGTYEYKNPDPLPIIKKEYFDDETAFRDQINFKNSAEIAKASDGTAVDFNLYFYRHTDHAFGIDHLRYEGRLKGQIGFDTDDRELYTDSWTAELSLNARHRLGDLQDKWRIPFYCAISTELEGDKDFDNLTGATGLWLKMETAKASLPIYKLFYDYNPLCLKTGEPEPAPLAPFWELGYQFATELKEDNTGFDYGNHRITARLSWELPLVRHLGPAAFKINGDLVIAAQGIYHAETGDFTDETEISAVFKKDTKDPNPLMLTLTYQQGKTTPTFENFDSFLVGFRQFF